MTGADWLLSLHLLSAVLLGAAIVGFWALVLGTRPAGSSLTAEGARLLNVPLTAAVAVGSLGTLVFGVWLAIVVDAYRVWDGWVIAAIVLWAAATFLGQRGGVAFARDAPTARRDGLRLQTLSTLATLAILVLMIWKPGA